MVFGREQGGGPAGDDEDRIARGVVDNLLEGCQVVGFDWRYLYVNDRVLEHGQRARGELIGRTMMECYPGIEATPMFALLGRCLAERTRHEITNEFALPDGSTGVFELRILPVPSGACVLSVDVTAQRRAAAALARSEEQLRHAQKMEAVGRLAGGVAHDFNNLLSVVLSFTGLILSDLASDDPIRADVTEIERAGRRAAELTRQLLTFSRHQAHRTTVLDLNKVVGAMQPMLARLLGAGIEVGVGLAPGLWPVRADAGQIEQVVMNLVVNARDAMPRGGRLKLQTENVELDEEYARAHLGVSPGAYVKLLVADSGVGMDRETRSRIFEPFFTTKPPGSGTGLGLATVFGIVQQSGGHLWVYSEPGHGTTFKVYLPRCRDEADAAGATAPAGAGGFERGVETVLVVEDDEQVRAGVRAILRRAGYVVLEAASAADAARVSEAFDGEVHLLLTDVVLRRARGSELARRLAAARPTMRVLYMSGYTDESLVQSGLLDPGLPYIEKPITMEALTRRVREVLAGQRTKR
jgi:signal transduction histidine kinase/ActR/RegA family two-component response regulator